MDFIHFTLRGLIGVCLACALSPVHATEPPAVRLIHDMPYGQDARQRMDVYLPAHATAAPVIFMVHGGAWRLGDKAADAVVSHKVARWVNSGYVFVSTNYKMLPDAGPLEQARDVARALAQAQSQAASWGADPSRFILMGHSAGAHLVALLTASPTAAQALGVRPWLGSVLLDSAALDVVRIMDDRHHRFYDQAFGKDPAYWAAASPWHALNALARPFLAVCSSRRSDACAQARPFVDKARSLGVPAQLLEQDLSHTEINAQLGQAGRYTEAVDAFMSRLTADAAVKRAQ